MASAMACDVLFYSVFASEWRLHKFSCLPYFARFILCGLDAIQNQMRMGITT
jgi:hypothetical protein